MREGAAVVVIGGIANEVALDEVSAAGGALVPSADAPGISGLKVPGGPTLRLLADGDGVNYAAGPGNPIQIMQAWPQVLDGLWLNVRVLGVALVGVAVLGTTLALIRITTSAIMPERARVYLKPQP